jgi:hypothetical protein
MDQDLEKYSAIRDKFDGKDDAVLKFLQARDSFGKARAEAAVTAAAKGAAAAATPDEKPPPLVSPEHAAAKQMMDELKLDLGITVGPPPFFGHI